MRFFRLHPTARIAGSALLAGLVVLLLYANTLDAFFTGDDFDILARTVDHHDIDDAFRMTFVGNWGPVSYVQFYLNYRAGGFDPLIYHLTNLLWHTLAVVALFGFVRAAWPEQRGHAWLAALLFLTHPANDQAVSYISSRSHTAAAALSVLALALHARHRMRSTPAAARSALFVASIVAAFLAGLSKESALTLPAWVVAFEWLVARRDTRPAGRSALRAVCWGLPFAAAAAAVFVSRRLVIGGRPPKLEDATDAPAALATRLASDLPEFALRGGLPFPFSWIDVSVIAGLRPFGWTVLVLLVVAALACLRTNATRPSGECRASGHYVLGATIALTTILPVIYAGLNMQRRYFYIANVGFVLMTVAALHTLRSRLPAAGRVLAILLVIAGVAGTLQRNELHRRSSAVARDFIETALERPVERLPGYSKHRRHALVTLPRYYGGDKMSGVLTLSETDAFAALNLFGRQWPTIRYALECHHAEDYTANVTFLGPNEAKMDVSFRSRRAYEASFGRDPAHDRHGDAIAARLTGSDDASRVLSYRLSMRDGFWDDHAALLVYSDGRFTRLRP